MYFIPLSLPLLVSYVSYVHYALSAPRVNTYTSVCVRACVVIVALLLLLRVSFHTHFRTTTHLESLPLARTHSRAAGQNVTNIIYRVFSQLHTHSLRSWLHRTCAVHLSCQLTAISQLIGALYRRNENQNRLPDMWFYGSKRKRAGLLFNSFALRCDRYRPM